MKPEGRLVWTGMALGVDLGDGVRGPFSQNGPRTPSPRSTPSVPSPKMDALRLLMIHAKIGIFISSFLHLSLIISTVHIYACRVIERGTKYVSR